ncbi:exosome complex component RRP45-like isoform X2 [Dendronephthya gigantea]|uniref:exosome complex component RRP45-like isoform X2 n=1 Tax=Dendronephthya gigantea TaxID=151771 RepID=UPI00106D5A15|nr:exosome complex component RRP45-like isoform X2 [Dendronephthya gigantea]
MKNSKKVISSCEKDFILTCIRNRKRIDRRQCYDYRKLEISFGVDRGHCEVQLGKTRVLAQVTSEIVPPPPNRPSEGQLFFNLELSPMASPVYETGRPSEHTAELNRLLERVYKQSRCVDVESLCIVAGEKVWSIRVDITVLDDGGNIIDCASIATITALSHYRRPDVSVSGEEVTVFSAEDRDPVPLSVLHIPVYVTFAFYDNGGLLLVDPTEREESVMDGQMMMAMNIDREICAVQMNGGLSLEAEQVLRCSQITAVKVADITDLIHKALRMDEEARKSGKLNATGITQDVRRITLTTEEEAEMDITETLESITTPEHRTKRNETEEAYPLKLGLNTAEIGLGGWNTWIDENILEHEDTMASDQENDSKQVTDEIVLSGESSEEDEIILLSSSNITDFQEKKVIKENRTTDEIKTKGKKK